jgi:ferredoxin/flavodoxin
MANTMFYFTGTGNSLKVAKDIIEISNIPDFNIVSIAKNISNVKNIKPEGIVGFVFPVYYYGIPKIVSEFLENIDLKNASYIFVVAGYGASGGNGGCLHQAKNIFLKNNIRLNAGFYIKTIDNFILWIWDVPSIEKHNMINKLTNKKVKIISEHISKETEYFDKSFMEYIGPVLFGYKNFIKIVIISDKSFFSDSNCNSCGICAKVCPTDNIKLNNGRPEWKSENCQKCLACLHLCSKKSIEYGNKTRKRSRYKNQYIKIEELFNEP